MRISQVPGPQAALVLAAWLCAAATASAACQIASNASNATYLANQTAYNGTNGAVVFCGSNSTAGSGGGGSAGGGSDGSVGSGVGSGDGSASGSGSGGSGVAGSASGEEGGIVDNVGDTVSQLTDNLANVADREEVAAIGRFFRSEGFKSVTRAIGATWRAISPLFWWWFLLGLFVFGPLATLSVNQRKNERHWRPAVPEDYPTDEDGIRLFSLTRCTLPTETIMLDIYFPVFDFIELLFLNVPFLAMVDVFLFFRPWRRWLEGNIRVHSMIFHGRYLYYEADFWLIVKRWRRVAYRNFCTLGFYKFIRCSKWRHEPRWMDSRINWMDLRRRVEPKILENQQDFVIFQTRPRLWTRALLFIPKVVSLGLLAPAINMCMMRRSLKKTIIGGRRLELKPEFPYWKAYKLGLWGRGGVWWLPILPFSSCAALVPNMIQSMEELFDEHITWVPETVEVNKKGQMPRTDLLDHWEIHDRLHEYQDDREGARRISRMDLPRLFVPIPVETGPKTTADGVLIKTIDKSDGVKKLYQQYGQRVRVGNKYQISAAEAEAAARAAALAAPADGSNDGSEYSDESSMASSRQGSSRKLGRQGSQKGSYRGKRSAKVQPV